LIDWLIDWLSIILTAIFVTRTRLHTKTMKTGS
jgi:hypothetical protein